MVPVFFFWQYANRTSSGASVYRGAESFTWQEFDRKKTIPGSGTQFFPLGGRIFLEFLLFFLLLLPSLTSIKIDSVALCCYGIVFDRFRVLCGRFFVFANMSGRLGNSRRDTVNCADIYAVLGRKKCIR